MAATAVSPVPLRSAHPRGPAGDAEGVTGAAQASARLRLAEPETGTVSPATATPVTPADPALANARPALYLVEPDRDARVALYRQVSDQSGRIVRSFASADAMLDQIDELTPGVVLMTNIGDEALPTIAALSADARFAVVSTAASASVRLAVAAMRAGACNLLEQPVDTSELMRALDEALAALVAMRRQAVAAETARTRIGLLSPRERQMLDALAEGLSNKQIGLRFDLSARTVETYRRSMMQRLGVSSLAEALRIGQLAAA